MRVRRCQPQIDKRPLAHLSWKAFHGEGGAGCVPWPPGFLERHRSSRIRSACSPPSSPDGRSRQGVRTLSDQEVSSSLVSRQRGYRKMLSHDITALDSFPIRLWLLEPWLSDTRVQRLSFMGCGTASGLGFLISPLRCTFI